MGADIHAFVETDPDEPGPDPVCVWADAYQGRNSVLFGLLADVRGGPAVYEPRGVPARLSPYLQAQVERWAEGAHSHHWLTLAELETVQRRYRREDPGGNSGLERIIQLMRTLDPRRLGRCRLVFFFDS